MMKFSFFKKRRSENEPHVMRWDNRAIFCPPTSSSNNLDLVPSIIFIVVSVVLETVVFLLLRSRYYWVIEPDQLRSICFFVKKSLRYQDIAAVRYSKRFAYFRLMGKNGMTIDVFARVSNIREFASVLLEKAPAESMDESVRGVLKEVARGDLPILFGGESV